MRKITVPIFIGLAIFWPLAGATWAADCGDTTGAGGTDVPCSCGDRVTTDTVLDKVLDPVVSTNSADLCPGNGLTVVDGVTLDLDGNKLRGSGVGTGVVIDGDGVTVTNGSVQGFVRGVRTSGTSPTTGSELSKLKVLENTDDGMLVRGDENTFTRNQATSNGARGMRVEGDLNTLERNKVNKNLEDGISIKGDGNILTKNKADSNAFQGITVTNHGNELVENKAKKNGKNGIMVVGNDNILEENTGDKNVKDGVTVEGNGNSLSGNRGNGNGENGVFADGGLGVNSDDGGNSGKNNGGADCEIDGVDCSI